MKKLMLGALLGIATIGAMCLQSCTRDRWNQTDSDIAGDNSLADATSDDIFKQADDALSGGDGTLKDADANGSLNGPCATVTADSTSIPGKRHVIIDFGTTNCQGNDGKFRRGKIDIMHDGKPRQAGSVTTVKTIDYYVNDNKVELDKTITNNGFNASNQLSWNIAVNNSKIILAIANGGGTISWSSSRSCTWIAGINTPKFIFDDKYEISGDGSGTDAKGNSYTMKITSPIVIDFSCNQSRFVKGFFEITPNGKAARVIDFGNGTCDNLASITVGKTTKTFTLKK
ncbi:MAG: hypothetical protein EXR21_00590 [Flavobacteriaceae bacterium]|nr:hypothetical protein [Flavobacteriaceae bacterium]